MRLFATAVLLCFAMVVRADDPRFVVKDGRWLACTDKELMEQASDLIAQGDKEALTELIQSNPSKFVILKPGLKVHLVDTALMSGLVQVRTPGAARKVWTVREAIDRATDVSPRGKR